jgi:methylenetetrahydrofolate--tRNA-(uracil-5-)-methyltransferase
LDPFQRLIKAPDIFLAGQISGVEGYVESAAQGLLAGENAVRALKGEPLIQPPPETALGALISHLGPRAGKAPPFAPSNVNFGLFPALAPGFPKNETTRRRVERAREALISFIKESRYVQRP